jgi:hypothetical protein
MLVLVIWYTGFIFGNNWVARTSIFEYRGCEELKLVVIFRIMGYNDGATKHYFAPLCCLPTKSLGFPLWCKYNLKTCWFYSNVVAIETLILMSQNIKSLWKHIWEVLLKNWSIKLIFWYRWINVRAKRAFTRNQFSDRVWYYNTVFQNKYVITNTLNYETLWKT